MNRRDAGSPCVALVIVLGLVPAIALGDTTGLGRTVVVPVDHDSPGGEDFDLYYELGAPFEPGKPTVIYVADGQQFRVRAGRMAEIQQQLFGSRFNLVGVPGRIAQPELSERVAGGSGEVDWAEAARVFGSRQWAADIDAVRRDLLGDRGQVLLYGGSGGGYLALEVLARYGEGVRRAFVHAAVMPELTSAMGVEPDRFWSDLAEVDPALQGRLRDALGRWAEHRDAVLMALSRQHYFHTADELPSARTELIEALARGDVAAVERARQHYQVDAVEGLLASTEAVPIRVRTFELHRPALDRVALDGEAVYPTLEMSTRMAKPLLELAAHGGLPETGFDILELEDCPAEVFVLAGRWDQAVDYRTQLELARVLPSSTLFVADDNHMFTKLGGAGMLSELVQEYLLHGPGHPATDAVLERMEPLRWDGIASPPPERYWGEPSEQQIAAFSTHVRKHFDDIHDVSMGFHLDDPSIGGLIGLRTVWFGGRMVMGDVPVNETGVEAEGQALLEAIRAWTIPDFDGPVDISNGFLIKLVGSDDPAFPDTAIVTGTVRDPDGAAIHRATVTFVGPDDPPPGRTNVQGVYVRTLIPPGTWELRCAAEGFRERVVTGVGLAARQHVRMDFVLEPLD